MAKDNLFIVFEGLDGAGCETQTDLIAKYLKRKFGKVLKLSYPDYNDPYGKLIRLHLQGRLKLTPEKIFLAHMANQVKDRKLIGNHLRGGYFVVANRYFMSNIAYNHGAHAPIDKAVKIASLFRLPKPDIIFYLKINPETSMKRKLKENKNLDVNEINKSKLTEAAETYRRLAKRNVWSQWFVIDGSKKIMDVKADIIKILKNYT